MKRFTALLRDLRAAEAPPARIERLKDYLEQASEPDRLWAVAILNGRRPRRVASAAELRTWAAEAAGIPDWLFASAEAAVGDLGETIALALPLTRPNTETGLSHCMEVILGLGGQSTDQRKRAVLGMWQVLGIEERSLLTALAAGRFRTTLATREIVSALAQATGADPVALAHRLAGVWSPTAQTLASLVGSNHPATDSPSPMKFAGIDPLAGAPTSLGAPDGWFADLGFPGARAQLCAGPTSACFWTDPTSLLTERVPVLPPAILERFAGSILDGVIVTDPGSKTRHFVAHDLLLLRGTDLSARPFAERREALATLMAELPPGQGLRISEELPFDRWSDLEVRHRELRLTGAACIYLRQCRATSLPGVSAGSWISWNADPFRILAALIYVERRPGNSRDDAPFLTVAVRDGSAFVPVAKLVADLAPDDRPILDAWIRQNTVERFGPVRSLPPTQLFELSFNAVVAAPRRKSGIALVGPRLVRWCRGDQPAAVADLDLLRALLPQEGRGEPPPNR